MPRTEPDGTYIVHLYATEGNSLRRVAAHANASTATVRRVLAEAGVAIRGRGRRFDPATATSPTGRELALQRQLREDAVITGLIDDDG